LAGNHEIAPTTYGGLPGDVRAGDQVLVDDGRVRLRVSAVEGTEVHTGV
jgi:pyruvate kinase